MGFLNILGEAEIHAIAKTWGKWNSIVREKYGKTQTFQFIGFLNISGQPEIHKNPKRVEK